MFSVPVIAILVATLFAVAIGNVWFTLLRTRRAPSNDSALNDSSNESFKKTAWSVIAYLLFFCALAFTVPLLGEYVSFLELAMIVTVFAVHPHFYLATSKQQPVRYFLVHASYTALVVFGGLAVITYWPW